MDTENWREVQKGELAYHLRKNKDRIRDHKIPYWKALLEKIRPFATVGDESRVLEQGCGSCGVLMALDKGELVGVDPLMNEYLEHFEYLRDAGPVWIDAAAEDVEFDEPFDIIFNINALDHVIDPALTVRKIDEFLKPGGHVILSLNCHETRFFKRYHSLFYRFIDSHHPHHFRPEDVLEMFPGYEVLLNEDIDELYFPQQESYEREVLQLQGIRWNKVFSYLLNPFKYPIAIARIFGRRPVHRRRSGQKAILACYLFVLRKPVHTG